jgi:hypothetical protein
MKAKPELMLAYWPERTIEAPSPTFACDSFMVHLRAYRWNKERGEYDSFFSNDAADAYNSLSLNVWVSGESDNPRFSITVVATGLYHASERTMQNALTAMRRINKLGGEYLGSFSDDSFEAHFIDLLARLDVEQAAVYRPGQPKDFAEVRAARKAVFEEFYRTFEACRANALKRKAAA